MTYFDTHRYDGCFTLGKDMTYESTGILVCGNNKNLTNKLCALMKDRGVEMVYPDTLDELNEAGSMLESLMMTRFRNMKAEQVNHVFKLKESVKPVCLVISNINQFFKDNSQLVVDARTHISSVIRLGKFTGIYVLVCCDAYKPKVIGADMENNLITRFYTDTVTNLDDVLFLHDKGYDNKHIPEDHVVCVSSNTILQGQIADIK